MQQKPKSHPPLFALDPNTQREENFYWVLIFAILLMANSLNLNSAHYAHYYIFRNLSMVAYMIKIQNQNSLIFNSVNLTNLRQVAKLSSVYIFIL
mgnify:CR=1 FL=1